MTKKIGKQPLPKAVTALAIAMRETTQPEGVVKMFHFVEEAMLSDCPRKTLNRCIASARNHSSQFLVELDTWVNDVKVRKTATERGCSFAVPIWQAAAKAMLAGEKAHKAFGMDKPGQPKSWSFTKHEDAAIYAEYAHVVTNVKTGEATDVFSDETGLPDPLDRRSIERARKGLPEATSKDLSEQAQAIQKKYGFKSKSDQTGGSAP